MSTPITKVALASPTGNLGPSILSALLSSSNPTFTTILVLVRNLPSTPFPAGVKAVQADYSSIPALESILLENEIQAVVSTLPANGGDPDKDCQHALLRASANVPTVRRFIPSEFGSNTFNAKAKELPVYGGKLGLQREMMDIGEKKKKEGGQWSWTIIQNGPFMDWKPWLGSFVSRKGERGDRSNINKYKFTRVEGGEVKFSTTTLGGVGKAVVGVLRNEEETRNKAVKVHEKVLTLNELWGLARKVTGSDEGDWEVENVEDVEEVVRLGLEELKKGVIMPAMLKFLTAACFGEGYEQFFEENDNELLGMEQLGDEQVLEVVRNLMA